MWNVKRYEKIKENKSTAKSTTMFQTVFIEPVLLKTGM
jgi:hypothetical protein